MADEDEIIPVPRELFAPRENWESDRAPACAKCKKKFHFLMRRRHHCRVCGCLRCKDCAPEDGFLADTSEEEIVRICDTCVVKVKKYYVKKAQERRAERKRFQDIVKEKTEGTAADTGGKAEESKSEEDHFAHMQQMQFMQMQLTVAKEDQERGDAFIEKPKEIILPAPDNWKELRYGLEPLDPMDWKKDSSTNKCKACKVVFDQLAKRRHHCRKCGDIFCDDCSPEVGFSTAVHAMVDDLEAIRMCQKCCALTLHEEKKAIKQQAKEEAEIKAIFHARGGSTVPVEAAAKPEAKPESK